MFLKNKVLKALEYTKSNGLPWQYWIFAALRILMTILPQTGYIHPDEYFQSMEVISGDMFHIEAVRPWEYNITFPVRNIFLSKLSVGTPYRLIKLINPYLAYYFRINLRNPYFMLVAPRLFFCLLSFINDICLYKICTKYGQNFRNRLKIFASSYVVLVFCTRMFSNSLEMVFFSLLLYLVADCMNRSDRIIYHDEFLTEKYKKAINTVEKVKLYKLKTHLPEHSLTKVIPISIICIVGLFNRPTFVAFAMPPVFFWLQRGLGSKFIGFKDFHVRIFTLVLCSIPCIAILILIDSVYYGYLTMAEVESLKISMENFVVTPLNFVKYNVLKENLAAHGIHPQWLHFVVNIPLLFGVLGLVAQFSLVKSLYRFVKSEYSKLHRIQSITGLMLFSFITPVAMLSAFPHQEPRFIIPVLIPIIYLYGNFLQLNEQDSHALRQFKKFCLVFWYGTNILLTMFFGFLHQGGVYPLLKTLHSEVKQTRSYHVHIVTSHLYSLPISLLQLDSTSKMWFNMDTGQKYKLKKQTFFSEYGSLALGETLSKINTTISGSESILKSKGLDYRLYFALPCSLSEQLYRELKNIPNLDVYEEHTLYPHLTTEAFPTFPDAHSSYCLPYEDAIKEFDVTYKTKISLFRRIQCFFSKFCLKVYNVSLSKYL